MRKQTLEKALLAFMAGATVLSSCVDDKYDLSNLDTTIQLGGGNTLTLPACSTGDIVLDNLFSLADDGPITKLTGNDGQELYYLDKDGEANPEDININRINIKKPKDADFSASIDLRIPAAGVKGQAPRKAGTGELSYRYDISDDARTALKEAEATGISSDVLDITRISFTPTTASLEVSITGRNLDIVNQVHFDSLALYLPTGLELSSCVFQGDEKLGSQALRDRTTSEGVIVLNAGEDTRGLNVGSGEKLKLQLTLSAADLGEGYGVTFNPATHSALLSGEFGLTGYARLSNTDINVEKLKDHLLEIITGMTPAEIAAELQKLANGQYQDALNLVLPSLDFKGSSRFSNDLTVQTFSGALQHQIDKIDDIKLDNLPDFLEGDDVTLDLSNPQLYLDIFTDLKTEVSTDIALVPYRHGVPSAAGVTAALTYDGTQGKHKAFMLAPNTDALDFPEQYMGSNYIREKLNGKEVGNLIRQIPDYIKVTGKNGSERITVNLPHCENIVISQPYKVQLSYRVFSPLTFGDDFQIVYRDTEDGMNLGNDLDDVSVEKVELTGAATSDIPLSLTLVLTPIDKQGREITGLQVLYKNGGESQFQSNGVKIRAGADGSAQDQFAVRVQAASGHSLNEFLHSGSHQLDGIKYAAFLNDPSSNADALKTTSKVQLKNLKISVTGASYLVEDDKK